ncbi:MAG TPA: hypothetical protein VJ652_12755 [Noviherbaspirillum sp.]|nr:hypothetical protein [Noviherbaspirillum sp.]
MAEIIGVKFWKPHDMHGKQRKPAPDVGAVTAASNAGGTSPQAGQNPAMFEARPPIDLTNPRLRKLAAAPGPFSTPRYRRTSWRSGSDNDFVLH